MVPELQWQGWKGPPFWGRQKEHSVGQGGSGVRGGGSYPSADIITQIRAFKLWARACQRVMEST